MKLQKLLPFFLLILFTQCDKEEPKPTLPPETTVGANTFGAIVNGEVWSFKKSSGDPVGASIPENTLLQISAGFDNDTDRKESIGLILFNQEILTKVYQVTNDQDGSFSYTNLKAFCLYNHSVNDNTKYSGTLEITHLDKVNQIVSGRFEFEVYIDGEPREGKKSCGTITVESGRFDLRYNG